MDYAEWQDQLDEAIRWRNWGKVDYLYEQYPEFHKRLLAEFDHYEGFSDV